jgi:hypothetical protein
MRVLPLRALGEPRTFVALFAVLFGALACASALLQVTDPDVWWIAAAGRDMLARGAVPRVNEYSFTDANHPWVMHEWLYGVMLAPGVAHLGPGFFALVGIGCGALAFGLSLSFAVRHARRLAAAALSVVVTALVAPALFGPRPSSAALSLALGMALLAFSEGWSRKRAVLAVGLEWLWAQLHGSFPLGVVILLVANLEHARERETRRARAASTLAAALVTFVNPYGARLHGLVAHYLFGDDDVGALIHQQIEEFQPLWRAGPVWASPPTLLALAVVVSLAGCALAHRRHRARATFVLALAAMAVHQARHAALAIVIGGALLVGEIDDLLEGGATQAEPRRRIWPLVMATVSPGLFVSMLVWSHVARTRTEGDWIDASLGGSSVLALAQELPAGARVYAPFAPSALLLWEASPRGARVFFDPRNDCYSADVLRASAALPTDPNADRALAAFGADSAIVGARTATSDALTRSPLWTAVARDRAWSLFRTTPPTP